jgi:RNA polymerase sigma-70 factor (ECF subfamily)
MDSQATHPSLLSRVRDPRDQQAWCEFESRYGDLMLRYARARGLSETDAEDVRQIVLMDLSKYLCGFHYTPARGRFRSYLGRCVQHAVRRVRARPGRARVVPDAGVIPGVAADEESDAEALWQREWIDHHYRLAMRTIRRDFDPRSVAIFDRLLAGVTVKALAVAHGISTQAVNKVKQRIRDRLRLLIAEQIRDEDEYDGGRHDTA